MQTCDSAMLYGDPFVQCVYTHTVLKHITTWFHANQLILNMDKMNIVKFTPTNIVCNPLTIEYDGRLDRSD